MAINHSHTVDEYESINSSNIRDTQMHELFPSADILKNNFEHFLDLKMSSDDVAVPVERGGSTSTK